MQKSTCSPLLFRIWVFTSGAVFAVSVGIQSFFSLTDYGFLYNGALLLVCFVSFFALLIGLTMWLCERFYKREVPMIATVVACALLSIVGIWTFVGTLLSSTHGGHTSTGAGSITWNPYSVHTSPEGTSRVVVIHADSRIYAYPMLNRWIYKEVENEYVWQIEEWYEMVNGNVVHHLDELVVEWPSERQAIVMILRDTETFEGENPDSRIVVDF